MSPHVLNIGPSTSFTVHASTHTLVRNYLVPTTPVRLPVRPDQSIHLPSLHQRKATEMAMV